MYTFGLKPSKISCTAKINAHASSCDRGAPQKVEATLLNMEKLRHEGDMDVAPDTLTRSFCAGQIARKWTLA
jgi:hypothetical protein